MASYRNRRRKKRGKGSGKPQGPVSDYGAMGFRGNPQLIGKPTEKEIVTALNSYKAEAKQARSGGLNPRDEKWRQNEDLYWGRYDFSRKAVWQAKEVMPEVSSYVDRFAAACKEALMGSSRGFYTIVDPADKEGDLSQAIKRATDVWLTSCGRNQNGHVMGFEHVFEEQVKLGALMACSSVVTWKNDIPGGRVCIEGADPHGVWLDHTNRNLYRIRRVELDRHELSGMLEAKSSKGKPIFNLDEIQRLIGGLQLEDKAQRESLTGVGQEILSSRTPLQLDEYIATVLGPDGKPIAERGLFVVCNDEYLLRGPEPNPFWHGMDWLVFAPLVNAPKSVYGRSYMEDFGSVAKTFNELTNMILDAVHTTSLKAYAIVPELLVNPGQLAEGIGPNKIFQLEGGVDPRMFASELDLGTLPAESVKVWEAMKNELAEAASINEVGLGQFAPNSRTSATEIASSQQSSSALVRSVAQTIEQGWLNPTLDLTWKTGLQHVRSDDQMIAQAMGPEMFATVIARRKEFVQRPITFQARGISETIQRAQTLKNLVGILGIIAQNEILLKVFMEKIDVNKLVLKLFELSNIDITQFQTSEREQMIASVMQPLNAASERASGAPSASENTEKQMQGLTSMMGIG